MTLCFQGHMEAQGHPPLAFDKGIDFDSYTLRKDSLELVLEWSNWFEWEIRGDQEALQPLAEGHGLEIRETY